jgi:hypothetical protein
VEEHKERWEKFLGLSRFEVGDGAMTKFWHDLWCGDIVLKEAYLVLFGIARAKDASVVDDLELLGDSNQWSVSFSREAHDWEVDAFAYFFQVLHSIIVKRGSEDRLWWVSSKKGLFTVGSFFSSLACAVVSLFPWKSVWRTQAPSQAAFFAWSGALDKILTMDNFRKKHDILVDHLLLHCDVAYAMCSAILLVLVCLGLCLGESLTCLPVGGRLKGRGVPRFGRWCRHAFFGVFGRKEIIGVSRIWNGPWMIF